MIWNEPVFGNAPRPAAGIERERADIGAGQLQVPGSNRRSKSSARSRAWLKVSYGPYIRLVEQPISVYCNNPLSLCLSCKTCQSGPNICSSLPR
jgi:hypothetical protein